METPLRTESKDTMRGKAPFGVKSQPTGETFTPELLIEQRDPEARQTARQELVPVICLSIPATIVPFAATIYAPLVDRLKLMYGVTTVVYNLNITFALVGVAASPLIVSPFMAAVDKKQALVCTWLLFVVLNIGSAFVNNLGGLVVLRFLAFLFGGPLVMSCLESVARIATSRRQYISCLLATTLSLLGLSLGPLVGGLIEGYANGNSRNWSRFLIPIISVVAILPYVILVPRDAPPVAPTKVMRQAREQYIAFFKVFVAFNVKEFLVIGITLYLSQLYFFFLITLVGFPYAFGHVRGYGTVQVALTYLSLLVGIVLSTTLSMASICQRTKTRSRRGLQGTESVPPEEILTNLLFCAPLIPTGIFMFAWTAASANVHWIVPTIGMILFSFGSVVAFTELNAYLATIYELHATTAMACPLVSQFLTASVAPLLTLFMIQRVTFQGSLSILAGVLLGLTAIPYLIWWKGPQLRNRSVYITKS